MTIASQRNTTIHSKFRSPLRYPGGKQRAIGKIFEFFPRSALEYREPMVGGGSVFFHARSIEFAKKYWINDKFSELTAFWQIAQNQEFCEKLMIELEELRSNFADASEIKKYFLRAKNESTDSAYREALLFFFFNRVTFSGTTRAGGFSSAAALHRFTASSIRRLQRMPQALLDVEITNNDFVDVIERQGKDVFIFLDPPYFKASKLYGRNGLLHFFNHQQLAECLKESKHKFLITYDDCDEIRKLYKWANIKPWSLQYGMNNCNLQRTSKVGAELFISNY